MHCYTATFAYVMLLIDTAPRSEKVIVRGSGSRRRSYSVLNVVCRMESFSKRFNVWRKGQERKQRSGCGWKLDGTYTTWTNITTVRTPTSRVVKSFGRNQCPTSSSNLAATSRRKWIKWRPAIERCHLQVSVITASTATCAIVMNRRHNFQHDSSQILSPVTSARVGISATRVRKRYCFRWSCCGC